MEGSFGSEARPATGSRGEAERRRHRRAASPPCSDARSGSWSAARVAVLARKGHVGQHVVLAGVHQVGQLGPAGTQLFGDLAPGLAGMGAVGLVEGPADRGGDDGVLAAGDVGQRVPHPVNAAALPVPATIDPLDQSLDASTLEHASDGGLEAGVGVADHQPHAAAAASAQGPQELGPEG